MNADHPLINQRDANGPCACGSALPQALCCGARTLPGKQHPAVFAAGDSGEDTIDDWNLAVTTLQVLAAVLPDVPVPLLGNRTPRALYHAGAEEREAAIGFMQAVARSADGMGFELPAESLVQSLALPEAPTYSQKDREKLALATFTLHLLARGVETAAVLGGQRLFRDLMRTVSPELESPAAYASAVDFAVCWMHFRPEANEEYPEGRREIAALYNVSADALAERFAAMKQALKLVWFDPRYAVQDPAWQERLERTARAIAEGDAEEDE